MSETSMEICGNKMEEIGQAPQSGFRLAPGVWEGIFH